MLDPRVITLDQIPRSKRFQESFEILLSMRTNDLFKASVSPQYSRFWIRDNFFAILPFILMNERKVSEAALRQLLNLLRKFEYKLDNAIFFGISSDDAQNCIHPRYTLELNEEQGDWGNRQNDIIGELLWLFGFGLSKGLRFINSWKDWSVIQKLVRYLGRIEYWQNFDQGYWEEGHDLRSSSVGACLAGLKMIQIYGNDIDVPMWLIENGESTLRDLLPKETPGRDLDLATLSLVFPYSYLSPFRIIDEDRERALIFRIKEELLRKRGVARYRGDNYHRYWFDSEIHNWRCMATWCTLDYLSPNASLDPDKEAEWTMGLPWLAIVDPGSKREYLEVLEKNCFTESGFPESFIGGTTIPNPHNPLAWTHAMHLLAYLV